MALRFKIPMKHHHFIEENRNDPRDLGVNYKAPL